MLEVSKVNVFYGEIQVLFDVSLKVGDDEIVCIIGSNGAGKSTLLKTISGLLHLVSGRIKFNGVELQKLPPQEITKLGVSYVAEGRKIFPSLTVLENLTVASSLPTAKKARDESLKSSYSKYFPD